MTKFNVQSPTSQPPACGGTKGGEEPPIDSARGTLLNLEGRAGALYWECVQRLLPAGRFTTRNHQGAVDDVNALLNYGYGILYSQVWSALTLAGLEPFAGFLHVDRPGKPSLVLDFIEEFRQPVVDRVVFAMINKRFKVEWEDPDSDAAKAAHQSSKPDAETEIPTQRRLSQATRRALADRVLARLQETERFERKQQKLCNIIQLHATIHRVLSPAPRHVPTPRTGLPPLHLHMVKSFYNLCTPTSSTTSLKTVSAKKSPTSASTTA